MAVRGYKDLRVWQLGMTPAKAVYEATGGYPAEERFGLVSQMRRAALSVPSNVAEGQARRTTKEFIQFVSHAEGSLAELETQILLSVELSYCRRAESDELLSHADELRRMLNSLRRQLSRRIAGA